MTLRLRFHRLLTAGVFGASSLSVPAVLPTRLACSFPHDTRQASRNWPMGLSSLHGAEIRTGRHQCFERVVIEFAGEGQLPGRRVGYVLDPVLLSPSDETVMIRGNATLLIRVASWMGEPLSGVDPGPTQIFPTNVRKIKELRLVENFEGMHQWAVGLDRARPFRVFTLANPARLVIDIGTS